MPSIITLAFLTGFGVHVFFAQKPDSMIDPGCVQKYNLLRRDLDCKSADESYNRMIGLQSTLSAYTDEQIANNSAKRISVFVRDLNSRRWIGINNKELFSPGSLLKIPLAVAYLKLSEVEPTVLKQRFVYRAAEASMNEIETYKPEVRLLQGTTYDVETLLEHMIKYSDNDPVSPLMYSVDAVFLKKVFTDLGTTFPEEGNGDAHFINVTTYSSLFRSLYLGSYLNIDNSEKILEMLTHTTFNDGIVAGISDKTIMVAHKFGEREVTDPTTGKQIKAELHDCGIVYKPEHSYILCVMTEGSTVQRLTPIIANISKIVFEKE